MAQKAKIKKNRTGVRGVAIKNSATIANLNNAKGGKKKKKK